MNLSVSGTRNQSSPSANTHARSVEPMPVAKLLSAPYVQLCESAPTTSSPGSTRPFSGSTVWQIPPCPTSKYHLMPMSRENSRVSRPSVALAASLAGWKWSCVTATRSGSQIFSAPICSRMIFPAGGMVRSWPIAKSTLASTRSPGRTLSRPAPRARIFSVIVMPIYLLILQPFGDCVTTFTCGQVAAQIARALARANGRFDRTVDRFRHVRMTQVFHHHRSAENCPDRVDQPAARDVWVGAVHGFEEPALRLGVDVARGGYPHPADELRGQVGQDVAEQVARDDDVELGRIPDELDGRRVDVQMARLDLRMPRGHRLPSLLPECAGVSHGVRLVDHHDLALSPPEGVVDDPGHPFVGVEVLLDRDLVFGAALEATTHAHVQALGVLAHDQQVDLSPVLVPQR